MREIVFRVLAERPGHLEAQAESPPSASPAHCTYRVRVRRGPSAAVSSIRPVGRRPAALCR